MLRTIQTGLLAVFVLFAALTLFSQLRCGTLSGRISRGEASEAELARMQGQAKKAAVCALISLAACMAAGVLQRI